MGIIKWLREQREFRQKRGRRVNERLRSEKPAAIDSLTSVFTGLGGGVHQVGRIEAEVEEEMKRERLLGIRRKK